MNISPVNFYGRPPGYNSAPINSMPYNKYLNYEHYTIKSVTQEIKHFEEMYKQNPNNKVAKMLIGAYKDILKALKEGKI